MPEARPAEPLSIVALAAGIGALVLTLFSVMPLLGVCFLPLGALLALTALLTGVLSLVNIVRKPQLDGRAQALTGIALSVAWMISTAALWVWMTRRG